ncbi:MAG: protein translocase subunit SecD [Candidatus Omnitrophica bacterium]|nr:protein translocase subunit SecD [Candidatus Omnitrophota bacterium]
MKKNLKTRILLILAVTAASLFFALPFEKRINLGLDLKGGMHLILKVETDKISEEARKDAVVRAMEILRNRIDGLGVGETVIQRQGENQILVQLPGVTDRDSALAIIGKVAQLAFKLVSDDPTLLSKALAGEVETGYVLKYTKDEQKRPILLEEKTALSGEAVSDARVDFNQTGFGQPHISLSLNGEGAKAFATLTRENVGKRLAIVLDGEVLSAPNIKEPILTGSAEISGLFTFEEANLLALSLRSGALPAPMHIEEERTVGPLLGKDSINAGIKATIVGGILVLVFMFLYYFISGLIANLALILNFLLIVGAMGFLNTMMPDAQATLTLPGIAGIILTLGMAVDANVLINERIREEIANGRPLQAAVSNGFSKAFKAIVDSNITTLIAAFMLFQFGSGPIKGFAVTLSIGLIASLFTALVVTRTLFDILIQAKILKSLPSLNFFQNTKIDFVSKRYLCYALSAILIIIGMVALWQKKDNAYGIDFAGGQIQEYKFEKPVDAQELRQTLQEEGLQNFVIQQFDKNPETIILRSAEDVYDKAVEAFGKNFPDNRFEIMRLEKVGPVVGQALRKRALLAILFALGGILVFVGFRFKHFDFAAAGVIAILHDVLLTLGLLILAGRQIDLLVITALLTIAGYSINDTIVIYDRVRENLLATRKTTLKDVINLSINQTLGRTILTTVTTLLVVVALYFLGGDVLNTFAFCLMVGFVSGTYSTIFIAAPLVLAWQKNKK